MHVYDFATAAWTDMPTMGILPSVRSCAGWTKSETHAYIHGGYDGLERKADLWALDLETFAWTELPSLVGSCAPSPRYFHSCCRHRNRLFVYGGYSGRERLADMYVCDLNTKHWSKIDFSTLGDVPSGRSSVVAHVYRDALYVFGGYNGSTVLNDFFRFRLEPGST
jgi:leucine-zipper-like transcriptional regulator 1